MLNKLNGEENLSTLMVQAQAITAGCLGTLGDLEGHLVGTGPLEAGGVNPNPASITGRLAEHVAALDQLKSRLSLLLDKTGAIRTPNTTAYGSRLP